MTEPCAAQPVRWLSANFQFKPSLEGGHLPNATQLNAFRWSEKLSNKSCCANLAATKIISSPNPDY